MQKFFTTTLVSKFIKYLLMCTPLPTCSFIEDLEYMVKGVTYLYGSKFYTCTESGVFNSGNTNYEKKLCCSDILKVGESVVCTDKFMTQDLRTTAKFIEVDSYSSSNSIVGLTDSYVSTYSYYDSETHQKLGDYLRLIRSLYDIDLMPLYNCFNNYYVDNIDLSSGKLSGQGNPGYSVTLVPIKFNKKYSISMNTSCDVFIKPVIYKGKLLQYPDTEGKRLGRFIYDDINPNVYKFGHMKYSSPVEIEVDNLESDIHSLEKYLYLAIQIPARVSTRITVIEGSPKVYNYQSVYDASAYKSLSSKDMNMLLSSASSLLDASGSSMFDTDSKPFSDKLVEYLIQHTIDSRDQIVDNLQRVLSKFGQHTGGAYQWSSPLRGMIFRSYMNLEGKYENLNFKDILGYVDKDIEYALDRGYMSNNE